MSRTAEKGHSLISMLDNPVHNFRDSRCGNGIVTSMPKGWEAEASLNFHHLNDAVWVFVKIQSAHKSIQSLNRRTHGIRYLLSVSQASSPAPSLPTTLPPHPKSSHYNIYFPTHPAPSPSSIDPQTYFLLHARKLSANVATKAANANQRNAVSACASRHLITRSVFGSTVPAFFPPLIMTLLTR